MSVQEYLDETFVSFIARLEYTDVLEHYPTLDNWETALAIVKGSSVLEFVVTAPHEAQRAAALLNNAMRSHLLYGRLILAAQYRAERIVWMRDWRRWLTSWFKW